MKLTAHTKTMNKTLSNVIAVITALSLVFLQMPIFGLAKEARADAANEISTQAEKSGLVDVKFSFDNAYVVVDGQVIAPPASKVTIPAGSDLVFTAEADNGYEVDSVVAKIGGSKTTLATSAGECRISGSNLLDGKVSVSVSAVALPEEEEVVEEEVVAAEEPTTEGEATVDEAAKSDEPADKSEEPGDNSGEAADKSDEAADSSEAAAPAGDESADAADKSGEAAPAGDEADGQEVEANDEKSEASEEKDDAETTLVAGQVPDEKPEASSEKDTKETEKKDTRSKYVYSDNRVEVTATLQRADAVPDNAELKVTNVTPYTDGYNYDVYLDALNKGVKDETQKYTDENTLLYDVAFIVTKEDGSVVEVEPEKGSVKVDFKFKNKQLKDELSASDSSDIEVSHLALKDKVMDRVATTQDATNITVSDVVVSAVDANVNVDKERSSFTTDSFSVFVFKNGVIGQANTWSGNKIIKSNDIYGPLNAHGLTNYAVVANELDSTQHIEGNVKVATFTIPGSSANLNEGQRVLTNNTVKSVTINKTVVGGQDGQFTIGFFKKDNTQVGGSHTIKTTNGSGSIELTNTDEPAVFAALNSGNQLMVYEIDGGTPLSSGATTSDGYTVSYSYALTGSALGTSDLDNLIGEINVTGDSIQYVDPHFFGANDYIYTNYFGQQPRVDNGGLMIGDKFKINNVANTPGWESKYVYVEGLKQSIENDIASITSLPSQLAQAKNGATNTTNSDVNVINLISTTGNLRSDLDAAGFATGDGSHAGVISGMLNSGDRLLINIDVTGRNTYDITSQDIYYDAQNPQGGNGYSELGASIIYNFVTKNADGSYSPYGGTVKVAGWTDGLILAPNAYVDQSSGYWVGAIIADKVKHDGSEIHKKTTTIENSLDLIVSVENKKDAGDLEISKTVVSDAASDKQQSFDFTVELKKADGTPLQGTYGYKTYTGNQAPSENTGTLTLDSAGKTTFSLSDNQKMLIIGIPKGSTYKVTEVVPTGFTQESVSGDEGTITSTDTFNASFTNKRDTGELTVSKKLVSSASASSDTAFVFAIELSDKTITKSYGDVQFTNGVATVTVKGGESKTITGLPQGLTYTVTEQTTPGFQLNGITINGAVVPEGSVAAAGEISSEPATVEFTNKANDTGNLKVSKSVITDVESDKRIDFEFAIKLTDSSGHLVTGAFPFKMFKNDVEVSSDSGEVNSLSFTDGIATIKLKDDEAIVVENLPAGAQYVITEAEATGFMVKGQTNGAGQIKSGETATAAFTNTRTGELTVKKELVSAAPDNNDAKFTFVVTLADKTVTGNYGGMAFTNGRAEVTVNGGESVKATGLPIGTRYEVTELSAEGFHLTAVTVNDDSVSDLTKPATGIIASTTPSTVVFTNAHDTGNLKVEKQVVSTYGADLQRDFEFTVELTDKTDQSISGTFGKGAAAVTFDEYGKATFTLKHGETKTISGLPAGAKYKVTETVVEGFTTTAETSEGVIIAATGDEAQDATPNVAFVNTRLFGNLEITKAVVSSTDADHTKKFNFRVTLKDQDNKPIEGNYAMRVGTVQVDESGQATTVYDESAEASQIAFNKDGVSGLIQLTDAQAAKIVGIPVGANYTVEEVDADGKAIKDNKIDGFVVNQSSYTGIISTQESDGQIAGATAAANFVNTKDEGGLTVSKTVESPIATDKASTTKFHFTVTLQSNPAINGTYGEGATAMTFTDNVAEFDLASGETMTATGLPKGVKYTVTETGNDSFVTEYTGETGEIGDEMASASFTNSRKDGELTVGKRVESDITGYTTNQTFHFTVTLTYDGQPVAGAFGTGDNAATFSAEGKAEFDLAAGQSKTIKGLPVGAQYTVEETSVAGFVTEEPENASGTIVATAQNADNQDADTASNAVTFVNRHMTAEAHLYAKKTLNGRSLVNEEFTFELLNSEGTVLQSKSNSDGQFARFDAIKYGIENRGKHTYQIREAIPADAVNADKVEYKDATPEQKAAGGFVKNGVEYDKTVKQIIVTVSYNEENKEIEVSYSGDGEINQRADDPTIGATYAAEFGSEFTNSYEESGTVNLEVRKEIDRATAKLKKGDYTFALYKVNSETASISNDAIPLATAENEADGKVVFEGVSLNNAGDSYFAIKEVIDTENAKQIGSKTVFGNIAYDETVCHVKVVGESNGQGKINVIETKYSPSDKFKDDKFTFNNTTVAAASVNIDVQKVLNGRAEWGNADSFTFKLAPATANAPMPKGENANTVTITKDTEGKKASFGPIAFNAENYSADNTSANTFTYTVTEDVPNDAVNADGKTYAEATDAEKAAGGFVKNGVTYNSTPRVVNVKLTATTDGELQAQVVDDKDVAVTAESPIVITNEYNATGSAELFAKKAMEGRAFKDTDEFFFTLSSVEKQEGSDEEVVTELQGQRKPANSVNNFEAKFDALAYSLDDAGKDFVYRIAEVKGNIPGVSYTEKTEDVTVHVADNGDGTLKVTYNGNDTFTTPTFTNTYTAAAGSASISVTKNFTGRVDDAWGDADSFSFELSAVTANAPMPKGEGANTVTITKDTEGKTATFGPIEFGKTGTYEYQVRELPPEGTTVEADAKSVVVNGITYNLEPQTVTVKVTDDTNGELHAAVTYATEGAESAGFTNTYTAQSTNAELKVQKDFTGRANDEWGNADRFTFKLAPVTANTPMPEVANADEVTIESATPKHTAAFGAIKYAKAGTYKYTITEQRPDGLDEGAVTLNGVTYDLTPHEAVVTVTDDGNGQLHASVAYDPKPAADAAAEGEEGQQEASTDACVIKNTYSTTDVSIGLAAKKSLANAQGVTLQAGAYSFKLQSVEGHDPAIEQTKVNAADGNVAFEPIAYSAAGTYTYTITEVIPDDAVNAAGVMYGQADDATKAAGGFIKDGMSYDSRVYTATVSVEDGGAGALVAKATYTYVDANSAEQAAELPEFTNTKLASSKFEFNKYHFGGQGEFTFELVSADENGNALKSAAEQKAEKVIDNGTPGIRVSVKNDGKYVDGVDKITFPEIVYAKDDTYRYIVKENESDNKDMVADKAQYLVTVVVENGVVQQTKYELLYEGQNLGETNDLSFYNNSAVTLDFNSLSAQSYADGERVSVYPKATKQLDGDSAQLLGGEFTFELVDNATGKVISTATNDENGEISFFDEEAGDPGLVYDEARDEPYTYTIREVKGNDASITYDTNKITLTVKVSNDLENGGLVADASYNGAYGSEPVFKNTKEGIDVVVQKVSRAGGEGLEGSTYALYMVGANGDALIQEAVSDSKGYIKFTNVNLMEGQKYYFKEVAAPSGHTVDPYRTAYFTLNEDGTKLVLAEDTTADGWHSAKENSQAKEAIEAM